VGVLNDVVEILFNDIEETVARHDDIELLSYLIGAYEAIVYRRAHHDFMLPPRLACYGDSPELRELVAKEMADTARAALAMRFLIEYVAARPPEGSDGISLAVHDRLLALGVLCTEFGFDSDFVHYGLCDPDVAMLPSGRLGRDNRAFLTARDAFFGERADHHARAASRAFDRHWREESPAGNKPEEIEAID
jgi:hypothetical protein